MEETSNDFLQKARDENTSQQELTELFDLNHPQIEILLAQNYNTPPQLLEKLAKHSNPRIRRTIAMNPSTPTKTLLSLASESPKTVLNNPIFPLLLLENPNIVGEIFSDYTETFFKFLKYQEVPQQFVDWAVITFLKYNRVSYDRYDLDYHAISVSLSLSLNPKTSYLILESIQNTTSKNINLRESAQFHINNHRKIYPNQEDEIAEAILNTQVISSEFKQLLFELSEIQLTIPLIPKKYYAVSLSSEEIASHPFTPQHLLEELADSLDWEVRYAVAANSNTSFAALEHLAHDPQWWVRQEVAQNFHTPPAILAELVKRENQPELLKTLALNPHTPLIALQDLNDSTTDPEIAEIITLLLSGKPSINKPKIVKPISETTDWEVRYQWANDPQTSEQILEQLARDSDLSVRVAVAGNPNIPLEILVELIRETEIEFQEKCQDYPLRSDSVIGEILEESPSYWLKQEAIKNPKTPGIIIEQLFHKYATDSKMFIEIAKSHNLSWRTFQGLINLNQANLYLDLAKNPRIPPIFLETMIKSLIVEERFIFSPRWFLPVIRYFALKPKGVLEVLPNLRAYPDSNLILTSLLMRPTTAKLLVRFIYSNSWLERYIVAIHPNSCDKMIKVLSQDANRIVRMAAQSRL